MPAADTHRVPALMLVPRPTPGYNPIQIPWFIDRLVLRSAMREFESKIYMNVKGALAGSPKSGSISRLQA